MKRPGRHLLAGSVIALASAASAGETVTYSYDALGRLTATSSHGSANNGLTTGISYDPAGNRSAYNVSGASAPPAEPPAPPQPPAFSVSGASVNEGGNLVFTISRSNQTTGAFSISYATSNGSAAQYSDYQPASGTLTFTTGASQTVNVATVSDTVAEPAETVLMTLSAPTGGATIQAGAGQAAGTINASAGPPPPPSNQPPVAVSDGGEIMKCNFQGAFDVVGNDYDPDGNTPLTMVSISYSGTLGTALDSDPRIIFRPNGSGTGMAVITYTVQDSLGATATGTLNLNVVQGQC